MCREERLMVIFLAGTSLLDSPESASVVRHMVATVPELAD